MANSGSFTTTSAEGRSLTFNWSVKSQSIANNQTTINWSLVGSGNYTGWVMAGPVKVKIEGNQVYYSSSRIQVYQGTPVASGTYTLTHNSNGSKSFSASVEAAIYSYSVNCSGSGSWSLPNIARNAAITNAPNFNDEANPTISYTNPAGNNVSTLQACISLNGSNADIPYRDISKTGTSYTFNLTNSERNTLRQNTSGKTRTVYFIIKTVINGTTLTNSKSVTFSIINGNPIISSLSYQDINSSTVAITQNNQQIIQNQSTLQLTITGVSAQKYASISKVTYSINSNTVDITNSYTNPVNIGTINYSSDFKLIVTATDSRGFSTSKTINIQMIAWELSYATINLARQSNFYAETDILVNAYCSSVDNKNSVTIKYQYKKTTESSYSALITLSNNTQVTENFDNAYEYDFKFIISDLFGSTTYNRSLAKGIPLVFYDRLLNSVGINCFPTKANDFAVNGKSLLPVTLFDDANGDDGVITLSQTAANFSYLEIFFTDNNNNGNSSIKIANPNGKYADLSLIEQGGTNKYTYIRRTEYSISGTSITPETTNAGYVLIIDNAVNTTTSGTNYIKVTKVIGWE